MKSYGLKTYQITISSDDATLVDVQSDFLTCGQNSEGWCVTRKWGDNCDVGWTEIDDSGAYIIKDSAGRKVFLSRYQAQLMKFGIENIVKDAFENVDSRDVVVEEVKE